MTDVMAPIDPLAPARGGRYVDPIVEVVSRERWGSWVGAPHRRTPHFALHTHGGRLVVVHDLPPDAVDEDLTGLLRAELFDQGWVLGSELFERIFTGVVLSTCDDPVTAWERFYRNTIRGLRRDGRGSGAIADYAPVYRHAVALAAGDSALEVGCCFGFLSLLLAREGLLVTASDTSAGTVRLVDAVAPRLHLPVTGLVCDAARVPLGAGSVDTVYAVHLLEHLEPEHGTRVVQEACRLARRRVVVAVPYEEVPDATFGHVRTVDEADLQEWGRASGHGFRTEEHHGGWLVIDVDA